MSTGGLTPDAAKERHTAVITQGETFRPRGISAQDARNYLKTDEGAMYWFPVAEAADPGTPSLKITERAVQQLRSGRELPRMETIGTDEPLVKIVPTGTSPTPYSPFWTKESNLGAAVNSGKN